MKFHKSIAALLCCLILLSACSKADAAKSGEGDVFRVVTSFYPMYLLTINVTMGAEGVTVVNMTEPQTGCLHDYELSHADMKALDKADLFIINGAGMESFLDKVRNSYPELAVVEASKGIPLITDEDTGEVNPHVWLSISNAILEVENIREALIEADPGNADRYRANAEAYVKKLEEQKDRMHAKLKELSRRNIVTFHEAFPYFAQEFGLNIVSVVEREPGTEPGASELAETIDLIKKLDVAAIFVEPQYSPKAAATIAAETGVIVRSLDPLVTGPKDASPDSYINTMEQNLSVLLEALKQ